MDLPEFNNATDKAREAAKHARNKVRSRISILPDKETCDHCGSVMEQSTAHDPLEGAFYDEYRAGDRPTWYCEDCDTHFRRENENIAFDIWK